MLSAAGIINLPRARYSLPTNDEVFDAIGIDNSEYSKEQNDCDDYTFRAKGKAAGKGWPFAAVWLKTGHVVCGWINDKKEFVLMEPQTRSILVYDPKTIRAIII